MSRNIVLAFTGRMASGKGSASDFFVEKHEAQKVRFSTPLRDILDRLYLEQNRDNMQELSRVLRKDFGEDVLARTIIRDIEKLGAGLVVVDGARRLADISSLRVLPNFYLIAMTVPARVRYERMKRRSENPDDRTKTWEQFQVEERAEAESLIDQLMAEADFTIDNDCSMEEMNQRLETMYQKIQHEG